jgi:pyridoxine kinase
MSKILAISSQTVFGPVGLSASVPALQSLGHEVLALPTIMLSHHPGHGKPSGQRTPATLMQEVFEGLQQIGALDHIEAVLTGYFADIEQVAVAAHWISNLKARHILVDPVIGDHGALYVPASVAEAIRDYLMPLATITTPNRFELQWLSGQTDIDQAVQNLSVAETLVTSSEETHATLGSRLFAGNKTHSISHPRHANVPHGTGDFLSGLYLAHRMLEQPATAFAKAMAGLQHVIDASAGTKTLKVGHITEAH